MQIVFCFCVPSSLWPYALVRVGTPRASNSSEHRRLGRLVNSALTALRVLPDSLCSWESSHPGATVLKLSAELADCPPPVNCCTYWAAPQHPIWRAGELPKPSSQAGPPGVPVRLYLPICWNACCHPTGDDDSAIWTGSFFSLGAFYKPYPNKHHPEQFESSRTKNNLPASIFLARQESILNVSGRPWPHPQKHTWAWDGQVLYQNGWRWEIASGDNSQDDCSREGTVQTL